MAPIVKTLPSYIKDSQHALEIVLEFHFLVQDKLHFTMDIKHFLINVLSKNLALKHYSAQPTWC